MVKALLWLQSETIKKLKHFILNEEVVITATDTVYGFLAPLTKQAVAELDRLKQRSGKPYLVLIGNKDRLHHFFQTPLDPRIQKIADSCWPGPLTIIGRAHQSLPDFIKGPEDTVALRMPHHQGLLQLLHEFDGLFSTSANVSGAPVPYTFEQIDPLLLQAVPLVVKDEQEHRMKPSTIIDVTGKTIRVVREGALPLAKLKKFVDGSC